MRDKGVRVLTVREILSFGGEDHIGARVALEDFAMEVGGRRGLRQQRGMQVQGARRAGGRSCAVAGRRGPGAADMQQLWVARRPWPGAAPAGGHAITTTSRG